MGKRLFLAATLAALLASVGCTRYWCEHRGYYPYPAAPQAAAPCCVPCCPPCGSAPAAVGYSAPPAWNQPAGQAAAPCYCPPAPTH